MARGRKNKIKQTPQETLVGRAGHVARDNPVAAGGTVVMGLTACLIVANAVGLQPGRHPAPLFSTRSGTGEFQLPEPAGRRGAVQVQEISTLVLDLQTSLRRLGLYEGPLDGLNGPATERAIRAFERKTGRIETGRSSDALLAAVHLQGNTPIVGIVPVPRAKPTASSAISATTTPSVGAEVDADPALMKIQKTLSDLGYGPLVADGMMGANTSEAIHRFELDRGLPLTGEPNPRTIERLEMVSGQKLAN